MSRRRRALVLGVALLVLSLPLVGPITELVLGKPQPQTQDEAGQRSPSKLAPTPQPGGVQVPVDNGGLCPATFAYVSYVSRYATTPQPGYHVLAARVEHLDPACGGNHVTLTLARGPKPVRGETADTVVFDPAQPLAFDFTGSPLVLSRDVNAVSVRISA